MGVAEVAAQLAIRQKEGNQKAMDDLSNMVKMERFKRLGKQFMDIGDYSPQGIQRFAQGNGVGIDEMQGLIQLVGQFQKLNKQGDESMPFAQSSQGIFDRRTGKVTSPAGPDPEKSMFSSVSPDKFTPASLAKFSQSKNYADLEPIEKPATGTMRDDKYTSLVQDRELGKPMSAEDSAFIKAYEKQKTLAPEIFAKTRLEIAGLNSTTPMQSMPGVIYDKKSRTFYQDGEPISSKDASQIVGDVTQAKAEAGQRGGTMTANINAANELYQQTMPEIIDLRNKVQKKGLLPASRFKDINSLNNWLMMKASDPDMAELQGKTKLMADNLQKTIGGAQGGEWAFKVADSLLDPSLAPDAFKRRLESHGRDLANLAKARRTFGKAPVAGGGEIGGSEQTGIEPRQPGESVGDYMKRAGLQ